jgi:ATP-dependent Clp protease ATP-binding subunit ClpA
MRRTLLTSNGVSASFFARRHGPAKHRLAERDITIGLTDSAKCLLAAEGFDPVYGARPLKRAIQKEVQDVLAMKILQGDFHAGDHVVVDAEHGELVFTTASEAVPA